MGGKKTVEKSREWEKERRDKLNVGFNDLYKLLPDHDPSISLSKMDILRKAAEYIRQLQEQNEEVIKSGDNDVLRNEADRLKKRVAYLLLKTKELVAALKAAGVPVPNNNKKKKKSKSQKVGKDQNHSPQKAGVATVHQLPCAVLVGSGSKPTASILSAVPLPGNKVKCGCEKAAKKNPLSEINCTSAATTSGHPVTCHMAVVSSVSQPAPTILGAPVQASFQTLAPALGPGTLIFKDGRVVTVPAAAPVVPQILVKPQPTFIVMQRAPVVPTKRDKVPLIAPKRREITQTTFANKAPIPAIKTFRLESYPRPYKPKGKKKKEAPAADSSTPRMPETSSSGKTNDSTSGGEVSEPNSEKSNSPSAKKRKRKAEAIVCAPKIAKPLSKHFPKPKAEMDASEKPENDHQANPLKVGEDEDVRLDSNDGNPGVVTAVRDSPQDSGTQSSSDTPGCVIASSQVASSASVSSAPAVAVLEVGADVKPTPVTKGCGVTLTTVEHSQTSGENLPREPSNNHQKSVQTSNPEGLSQIDVNSRTCLVSVAEESSTSVTESNTISETFNVLTGNTRKDSHPPQISQVSHFIEKNVEAERDKLVAGPSDLNRTEFETVLTSEEPQRQGIPRDENKAPPKDTYGSVEESRKLPLIPDRNLQEKGLERNSLSLERIEQFRSGQTSGSTAALGNTYFSAPKTCPKSVGATAEAECLTSGDTESPGAKINHTSVPSNVNHAVPVSLQNAVVMSSNGFPTEVQSVLLSHPGAPLGPSSANSAPPTSCSLVPAPPLFRESASVPAASACSATNLATTAVCSAASNSFWPLPTSGAPTNAPVACSTPLFHSAPSETRRPVFSKPHVDSSVVGPSGQFPLEDGQMTSSSVNKFSNKSVPSEDLTHTTPQKDLNLRNNEFSTEQRTTHHNLDGTKNQMHHRTEPFTLQAPTNQLEDMQCSKSVGSSRNGSLTVNGRGSQKSSCSENLDRTSSHLASQPNISSASTNTSASLTASSSQVYAFGISVPTEPPRSESFFNYENPIATLPPDPFFGSYKPLDVPVSSTGNTGFYSTFTTQAPPVRAVTRQLFPADPLSSMSSSYNVDAPLNSSTGQKFQFSSYPATNSFRDPLLFTNDFLSTPTKNSATLEAHEKDSLVNNSHSFPDLLHPNTSVNSMPNIPCSFGVGQAPPSSSSYVTSDLRTDQPNRKQYQVADQSMFITKPNSKTGADGNFSMNVITSSSELRVQNTRNSSDFGKPGEPQQNFNFPYLNTSQALTPQMSLESFNFNMRDPVQQSHTDPSRNLVIQNHTNPSNHSLVDKNFQKPSGQGLNQKSSLGKAFCTNTSVSSSSSTGLRDVQQVFHGGANNAYQGTPDKSTQGPSNYRCSNNSQSSNQGVQTLQSYLCGQDSQQVNKSLVPPSGSQGLTCASQANQQTHYDKYPKTHQDSLYAVSENHMKVIGQTSTDSVDCSLTVRAQKNYQPVSSVPQSLKTSSNNMNFSSAAMFSHTNANRPLQAPVITYPGAPGSNAQSIYSHPTTAASGQGYVQFGDGSGNTHQNLFRLGHMNTGAQSNPSQRQSNLCSSSSQIFSTVESLAQQHLNANSKTQNNAGNLSSRTREEQPAVNVFGMGAPQNLPNQKDSHTDMMTTFSMSNITGYPSHNVPSESNASVKSNQNQTYSRANAKQIPNALKGPQQYPPNSSHNSVSSDKHCDYPLSSILTGLNDSMLNANPLAAEPQASSKAASSEKTPCSDKIVGKQYSTNTEGSSFKTAENSCNADYLRNKDNERNFMPIMDDVRLNSEFSNDLFSSLQVPTGGAHADSISPTAAFLLAFPLVSTSKNSENPQESDPQDNNTSTPTTILQIGNIEPSNSELFHPLEFGKDLEASEYLGQLPEKYKKKDPNAKKKPNVAYSSYNYPSMSGDYNVHYDQSWSDQSKNKSGEARKKHEKQSKFCGNSSNYEHCKDKKKKSKISVNWMAAPETPVDTFQKDQEASSFQANLSFTMDIDALPDLCSSKKNAYSWSPSKSLLPLDSGLVIPSTLPTLVGDLALGTPTPADIYKRCDGSKKQDKSPEKHSSQKSQSNFLSVSQLVDPKSKKKLPDKCKKTDKKKGAGFQKRKDPSGTLAGEQCMYSDGFLPPLGWDKYRYKNNYSAEALIAPQDVSESMNVSYQQNTNYFMGSELNQEHHHQSQQYQNSFNFPQNQFPSFVAEEYQNPSFSINHGQSSASKRGGSVDKRFREEPSKFPTAATYQNHPPSLQPYPAAPLPPSSVPSSSHSSVFTSNTTTSVTNFNLSTIFPEINERTASQGQSGTSQQQQHGAQTHHHNNMGTFQNANAAGNYRTHNL